MNTQEKQKEKKGRPQAQNLDNVEIRSWTVHQQLNNLIEFLLQEGRIQLFQICGVGHKQIVLKMAELKKISQQGREQDVIKRSSSDREQNFNHDDHDSQRNFNQQQGDKKVDQDEIQVKNLLKEFSKKFLKMSENIFQVFQKKLDYVYYLEKRVKRISMDENQKLKIDCQNIDKEYQTKIKDYESQLSEKQISMEDISTIEKIDTLRKQQKRKLEHLNASQNERKIDHQMEIQTQREIYILLTKLKLTKLMGLVCLQLNDNTLNMIEYIALQQIEDSSQDSGKLIEEIKQNPQIKQQFIDFIDCCSIRNFLKEPLEIQQKIQNCGLNDEKYENILKSINCFEVKNCLDRDKLRQTTIDSGEFKNKIERLYEIVNNILEYQ